MINGHGYLTDRADTDALLAEPAVDSDLQAYQWCEGRTLWPRVPHGLPRSLFERRQEHEHGGLASERPHDARDQGRGRQTGDNACAYERLEAALEAVRRSDEAHRQHDTDRQEC